MFVVIIIAIFVLFVLFSGSSSKAGNEDAVTKNEKAYAKIINSAPEKAKPILLRLKEVFDSNAALSDRQLVTALGIPAKVQMSEFLGIKDTLADDLQSTWWFAISQRNLLQNARITPMNKNKSFQNYEININQNELLYHRLVAVELHDQKVIRRETISSGIRWNQKTFHSGRMSYSTEIVKHFIIQDVGRLYLTNKRIIFTGKYKNVNRSYNFDNILTFTLYQDGILLGLSSGKLALIKFQELDNTKALNDPNEIFHANDGMNRFVRVVARILNGTTEQNLQTEEKSLPLEDYRPD